MSRHVRIVDQNLFVYFAPCQCIKPLGDFPKILVNNFGKEPKPSCLCVSPHYGFIMKSQLIRTTHSGDNGIANEVIDICHLEKGENRFLG